MIVIFLYHIKVLDLIAQIINNLNRNSKKMNIFNLLKIKYKKVQQFFNNNMLNNNIASIIDFYKEIDEGKIYRYEIYKAVIIIKNFLIFLYFYIIYNIYN